MTVPTFEALLPIRRRLARARQINAQIEQICTQYIAGNPARLKNRDGGNDQTEVVLELTHEPPPVLAYMAGESVHNVRAALDNLVALLAEHANGGPLQVEAARQALKFPISRSREKFDDAVGGKRSPLVGIDEELIARIRDVQPFEHYAFSGTPLPSRMHVLARLQALSNRDKHMRVTVISRAVENVSVHYAETLVSGAPVPSISTPPYGDGDVVVRLIGRVRTADVRPRVEVQLEIPPFRTPEGGWTEAQMPDLPSTLRILVDQVEMTVLDHVLGDSFASRASHDDPDLLLLR